VLRARQISRDRMRTPTSFDGPGKVMCYTASVPRRLPIPTKKRGYGQEKRNVGRQLSCPDVACAHTDSFGGSRSTQRSEKSRDEDQLRREVLLSRLQAYIEKGNDTKANLNMTILRNPSKVGELPIQSTEALLGI
jgi:hypothetical protein